MPTTPIQSPAAYVPSRAAAFSDVDGSSILVSTGTPLPVQMSPMAGNPALAGTTTASAALGPFIPRADRPVVLSLSGTWAGLVRVLRSTDGGANRLPLTIAGSPWAQFTANCCEAVWEEAEAGATLYLDVALTSGTLGYRLGQ